MNQRLHALFLELIEGLGHELPVAFCRQLGDLVAGHVATA